LRTCPSCGKANNPIRKYCVRCGKSLIISKDDEPGKKPLAPSTQPAATERPEQVKTIDTATKTPADGFGVTTGDQWVKPSQVQRERMRTTSSSRGKSEMEKAKEAFARAEKVGIQDEEGDIVETRMLRASDVRELMQDVAAQSRLSQQSSVSSPSQYAQKPIDRPVEQPSITSTQQSSGVSSKGPGAPSPARMAPSATINSVAPRETMPAQTSKPIQPQRPVPSAKHDEEIMPTAAVAPQVTPARQREMSSKPEVSRTQTREMDAILSCITHSEDLQDSKVKDFLNELTNLHREMQEVTANKISITTQLDTRVQESHNKSEVKRIQYESINEQLRLAKQEWDDARSEYDKAENRRKRELSTLDDRIKNIQKRIDKAEGSVRKRVGELDKVREKIAQLQNQES
jgi:hypothetical protein